MKSKRLRVALGNNIIYNSILCVTCKRESNNKLNCFDQTIRNKKAEIRR